MWQSHGLRFASDHPTAAGHFPGNPIIPGALLLDEVVRLVAGPAEDGALVIRTAKFFHPVRPGDEIVVRWEPRAAGEIGFECRLVQRETLAAAGTIEIGPRRR